MTGTVEDRWLAYIVSPWNPNDTEAERGKKERWDFIKIFALEVLAFSTVCQAGVLAGVVVSLVAAPPLVVFLVTVVFFAAVTYGVIKVNNFLWEKHREIYDGHLTDFEKPRRAFAGVKEILRELAPVVTSGSDGAGVSKLCTRLEKRLWIQETITRSRTGFLFYSLLISDQESRELLQKICRDPETSPCRLVRERISSCWVKIATKLPDSELFKILTPDENCRQLLAQLRAHQEGAALSPEEQQAIVDRVLQLTTKPGFNV